MFARFFLGCSLYTAMPVTRRSSRGGGSALSTQAGTATKKATGSWEEACDAVFRNERLSKSESKSAVMRKLRNSPRWLAKKICKWRFPGVADRKSTLVDDEVPVLELTLPVRPVGPAKTVGGRRSARRSATRSARRSTKRSAKRSTRRRR